MYIVKDYLHSNLDHVSFTGRRDHVHCPSIYQGPFYPPPITPLLHFQTSTPPCQADWVTPSWEERTGSEHRLAKALGWRTTNGIRSMHGQWLPRQIYPISSPSTCPIYPHNLISVGKGKQDRPTPIPSARRTGLPLDGDVHSASLVQVAISILRAG